ncbi:hypothetical protein [Marinoscillum furvescens]|uniref:Lipoprotein n=1 Tax=Marinoscillum furvescens DSM 4134 TaxID=1122208 RepID=A0A3D9L4Y8_MARFU|nr:hypothetical protein [Marinoscillum furvescens]RED97990.1 hypothetical protein C7460_111131 [Marinoscillum furvescens DSM 4134]
MKNWLTLIAFAIIVIATSCIGEKFEEISSELSFVNIIDEQKIWNTPVVEVRGWNSRTSSIQYYLNDELVAESTSPPFSSEIRVRDFLDGNYELKAISFVDGVETATTNLRVQIENTLIKVQSNSPVDDFMFGKFQGVFVTDESNNVVSYMSISANDGSLMTMSRPEEFNDSVFNVHEIQYGLEGEFWINSYQDVNSKVYINWPKRHTFRYSVTSYPSGYGLIHADRIFTGSFGSTITISENEKILVSLQSEEKGSAFYLIDSSVINEDIEITENDLIYSKVMDLPLNTNYGFSDNNIRLTYSHESSSNYFSYEPQPMFHQELINNGSHLKLVTPNNISDYLLSSVHIQYEDQDKGFTYNYEGSPTTPALDHSVNDINMEIKNHQVSASIDGEGDFQVISVSSLISTSKPVVNLKSRYWRCHSQITNKSHKFPTIPAEILELSPSITADNLFNPKYEDEITVNNFGPWVQVYDYEESRSFQEYMKLYFGSEQTNLNDGWKKVLTKYFTN